jgi:outer membrane protein assembly factor BamB
VRIGSVATIGAVLLALAGCGERELILPGERIDVRTPLAESLPEGEPTGAARVLTPENSGPVENRVEPVALPAAQAPGSWPQRGLNPTHRLPHLALAGGLSPLWAAEIGAGNDRRHRIASDPVSDGSRIFAMDSRARVTAVSTGGAVLWSTDLTPPEDNPDDGSGGGLALSGGQLFATTGFGTLVALDPATGRIAWTQRLGAVGNASPSVVGGLVYVIGRDNNAWAVRASDGKIAWTVSGPPAPSGYVGGGGAAVDDRIAVLPFAGGGLTAVLRVSGVQTWATRLSGDRTGKVYAAISDITSDPVLDGDTLYAANASGRLIAADAGSGERLWTATEGSFSPVVLAGGSIFLVSDNNEVVRLSRDDGTRIWGTRLPDYVNPQRPRRLKARYAHFGPLLAGGRLLVASSDGQFRLYDPASGNLVGAAALPGGAASNPIVVGGIVYVVTTDGRLLAFR